MVVGSPSLPTRLPSYGKPEVQSTERAARGKVGTPTTGTKNRKSTMTRDPPWKRTLHQPASCDAWRAWTRIPAKSWLLAVFAPTGPAARDVCGTGSLGPGPGGGDGGARVGVRVWSLRGRLDWPNVPPGFDGVDRCAPAHAGALCEVRACWRREKGHIERPVSRDSGPGPGTRAVHRCEIDQ
jgi:hypothetical protein